MDNPFLQNIIDTLITTDVLTSNSMSYVTGNILPSEIAVAVDGIGAIDFPIS